MRKRSRLSRWMEKTLWITAAVSTPAWALCAFCDIGIYYSESSCLLSAGTVQFNSPTPYDWRDIKDPSRTDPSPWHLEIDEPADRPSIADRFGLVMPIFELYLDPTDITACVPMWFQCLVCGLAGYRIRRGPKFLLARSARRRRRFAITTFAVSLGMVGFWYTTWTYVDVDLALPGFSAWVREGEAEVYQADFTTRPRLSIHRQKINLINESDPRPVVYFNGNSYTQGNFMYARFPVWLPATFLLLVGVYLSRSSRFVRIGVCGRCGYYLTGNTSGKCSECGEPVPAGSAIKTIANKNPNSSDTFTGGTPAR